MSFPDALWMVSSESVTDESADRDTSESLLWKRSNVILFAAMLLPWLTILAAHYLGNGDRATGFIQYDQPYYVANGRAAFERGDGLRYPNPSDSNPDAPVIYFHWLPWTLGLAVSKLGFEPGVAYSLLTAGLLPVFGWLTWLMVCRRATSRRMTILFLALWSGGMLSLLGLLKGMVTGLSWSDAVFEFDPTEGLWFLNWGRNTVYGIEITYHCFVAASWLFVLRQQHWLALLCAGLLGLTHPWSGLELLLMLNAWMLLEAIRHRSGRSYMHLGTAMCLIILLLGYYKLWLPQFPSHAALQANWSLNWRAEWSTILYAYSPVALLGIMHLMGRGFRLSRDEQFLAVAAAVAFGLTIHDRILPRPVQPLHFSRGYIWMPLFLIAVPQIQKLLAAIADFPAARRRIVFGTLMLLACFDNLAFTVTHSIWQYNGSGPEGFYLADEDRQVLAVLNQQTPNQVIFCESLDFSYLMTTYAPVRPWLCHKFNTPDYVQRQKDLHWAILSNSIEPNLLPPEIEVLVLANDRDTSQLTDSPDWREAADKNEKWQVWLRTSTTANRNRISWAEGQSPSLKR